MLFWHISFIKIFCSWFIRELGQRSDKSWLIYIFLQVQSLSRIVYLILKGVET